MLVFSTRLPLKAEITHEDCMRLFTKWVKGSPHYQTDGLYFDVDSHDDYDYTKDNMTFSVRHYKDESVELSACRLQNREPNLVWDTDCVALTSEGKKSLLIQLNCNWVDFRTDFPRVHKPHIVKMCIESGYCSFDRNITVTDTPIIADESISNLEVTALPENPNATVNITGNTNLKNGLNKIKIEVVSENKKNKSEYIINVTKTDDIEDANANLENLAIEGGTLSPEFDNNITKYNTEVEDTMEKLNILAIAEDERAKVEIVGGEKLEYGNNTINIKVTSVNGITTKNYVVNVYRRTKEEEQQAEKEQEESQEQAENIIENMEKQPEQNVQENIEQNQDQKNNYLWIIALVVITIIIILIVVYIKKKSEKIH